jgi:glycerate-2-kinase
VLSKLQEYEALNHYLRRSLKQRLVSESWFENRVIRYVLQQSSWVRELDETFQAADLDSVPNSGEIFGVLRGSAQDFDERLFDALAEVRLVAWARGQGYDQVEKLKVRAGHPTPDCRMERDGRICLAEVSHFQLRDYLVYLVADRLEGLGLKMDMLKQFGLSVDTTSKYLQKRDDIVRN